MNAFTSAQKINSSSLLYLLCEVPALAGRGCHPPPSCQPHAPQEQETGRASSFCRFSPLILPREPSMKFFQITSPSSTSSRETKLALPNSSASSPSTRPSRCPRATALPGSAPRPFPVEKTIPSTAVGEGARSHRRRRHPVRQSQQQHPYPWRPTSYRSRMLPPVRHRDPECFGGAIRSAAGVSLYTT